MLSKKIFNDERNFINVTGVPGSGKTTLAVEIASMYNPSDVLYLSFGRENTIKVRKRLLGKATCLSFHAFAKNALAIDNLRIINRVTLNIINQCTKNHVYALQSAKELECIMLMIDIFCKSNLKLEFVHKILERERVFPTLSQEENQRVNIAFRAYWRSLWDEKSTSQITHDMYLKEYSLRKIKTPYKLILVDENQDLNDAMHHLVEKIYLYNNNAKVISFGDPCQQIFSFRGSSRRFLEADYHYKLSNSHRFGVDLANLCNAFMSEQNVNYYTEIQSKTNNTEIIITPSINNIALSVNEGKRPVLISRFNYTLWQMLKDFSERNIKCALLGGISKSEFDFLRALNQLFNGIKTRHLALAGSSYVNYKRMARGSLDRSALLACRFVESVGENTRLFDLMKTNVVEPKNAEILLTTVHQAKGLEFNDVFMLDDFPEIYDEERCSVIRLKEEEAHLIYTAISRAKKTIGLTENLQHFMNNYIKK